MVIILRRSLMKKSLVFAGMMLAALALSASAAEMPGPEPNKREVFAFTNTNNGQNAVLVAVAPNETAGNVQSSGFMITGINSFDRRRVIDPFNKNPRDAPAFAVFAPKLSDGAAFASMTNPRELHPEGITKL